MSCGCGCSGEVVAYENWDDENVSAAEYQGRKVTLNKPFRTKGESKKFGVYTKNGSGKVVIVRFGDPNMEIKRDSPERRKSFRSRHKCNTPGPKWKARYWSCRQWRSTSPVEAEALCGCGCEEDVEAKDADDPCTPGYEQYGMKTKNGRKVPNCIPIKKKAEATGCAECNQPEKCDVAGMCLGEASNIDTADMVAAVPSPNDTETHDAFMSRCTEAGNSKEACMLAHKGHEFKVEGYKEEEEAGYKKYASDNCACPVGEELINGECKRVAVTLDLSVDSTNTFVEATTGNTVIEISGVAFHEGMNKNSWAITSEGARNVARQMEGADLTLNHPDPLEGGAGFDRNISGGVDMANVGYIKSATFLPTVAGGYEVRYIAHILRPELFEAAESGLWLKPEYGVSIGGSGIPVSADDEGITFGEDFTFDHLAIVHRPAYPRANIEKITKIEKPDVIEATIISHSISALDNQEQKVAIMTEEIENTEIDYAAEIESLKADLVMANSRVNEFETVESQRIEDERMALVTKASEMGMSGHDDLKAETLNTLIASWESSHPTETIVEMKPIDETPSVIASEVKEPRAVVANYLNGTLVESDENLYSRCWNAWAKAWNGTLSRDESNIKAPMYNDIKEMN